MKEIEPSYPHVFFLLSRPLAQSQIVAFARQLRYLNSRFECQFILAVAEPSFVFDDQHLDGLLKSGTFFKAQITGHAAYFFYDVLSFAKRQQVDACIFVEVATFIEHFDEWLAFYVKNAFLTEQVCFSHKIPTCILKQHFIRNNAPFFADEFETWLAALRNPLLRFASPNTRSADEKHETFITATGLKRFGGIDKFRQLPLVIGDYNVERYDCFWCLDQPPSQELPADKTLQRYLPQFIAVDESTNVVFDINPAYSRENVLLSKGELLVPRTVLTVTAIKNLPSKPNEPISTEALFIMSCFNKAKYIASACYSILMQTYANVSLVVVDDGSVDSSVHVVNTLNQWLIDKQLVKLIHTSNMGTYWIRNLVINKHTNKNAIYLINDADDFSSAQRAWFQLYLITNKEEPLLLLLADIVRTDDSYNLLELEGQIEHYGSATLAARLSLHADYGYFEHLRKGADTEFINRIKRFGGEAGFRWYRYPVLFQPFDGNNLTADIYEISPDGSRVELNIEARSLYQTLYPKRQRGLTLASLTEQYGFPAQVFPSFYYEQLADFMINKFAGFAQVEKLSITDLFQGYTIVGSAKADLVIQDNDVTLTSTLDEKQHTYIYSNSVFQLTELVAECAASHLNIAFSFVAEVEGRASMVLLFQDMDEQKVGHQFFYAQQVATLKLPPQTFSIKLGVRLEGHANIKISETAFARF